MISPQQIDKDRNMHTGVAIQIACLGPALLLFLPSCCKEPHLISPAPDITSLTYKINNCSFPYQVLFSTPIDPRKLTGRDTGTWWKNDMAFAHNCDDTYHTFPDTGTYVIKLEVKNENGMDTQSITLDLSQSSIAIISNFSWASIAYVNCALYFSNTSQYAKSYLWDFGDMSSSNEINPSHSYRTAGPYSVVLKAICNSDTVIYSKSITAVDKLNYCNLTAAATLNDHLEPDSYEIYPHYYYFLKVNYHNQH